MRPKWPKLASLAQKPAQSSFNSSVQSLLPKDNLSKIILYLQDKYFNIKVWARHQYYFSYFPLLF